MHAFVLNYVDVKALKHRALIFLGLSEYTLNWECGARRTLSQVPANNGSSYKKAWHLAAHPMLAY